jgi:flagellar protein FliO/FliZ
MKIIKNMLAFSLLVMPLGCWVSEVMAADAVAISPSGGVLKMVLGLAIVLAVMALITWLLKRMMPGVGSNKQSVVRIVGGVSVGSRERIVVVEVAGRWLVVGVAPGQVNSIANLEIGATTLAETSLSEHNVLNESTNGFTETFAQWLTQSTGKILDKKDVKN